MRPREFSADQCPGERLRDGGPLLEAWNGLRALLVPYFPESLFRYRIVQPRMSPQRWQEISAVAPMIGMSWAGWTPGTDRGGRQFRGDASFPIFLLVKTVRPDDLILGTDKMPGAMGVAAIATHALNGKKVTGGTVRVRSVSNLESCDWINDRTAIVTMNVVVENLAFNERYLTADMPTLTRLEGTWAFTPGDGVVEDVVFDTESRSS
ncbi:hypothetical protein Geu3261_0269_006 [Komagataeibacter europaeus NBRC 3261]|uniref:Uncharacterized protein n=1 Tax=Komagataeibacter europaeus NBRC 3261 TaxID=1234669 RepID=A0A0D6Q323_KOMEU|nr:hypothetical protein [Komagataeibacter europaeus]GAN97834.1 hypothetical protein Geu3261_0269_006 [Komagataeibacter europaeus NBRC 3261]